MLRHTLVAISFLTSASALAADYQCSVNFKDDIIVTPQSVQVVGANGDMIITPKGDVTLNGQVLNLNEQQKEKALRYQSVVRNDLPWIKQQSEQKLANSRQSLDKVVIDVIGEDSNVRNRLTKLESDINRQINQVIETSPENLTFHHQAINKLEAQGKQLMNESLGGMLQDSINEMGRKQLLSGGDAKQSLQGLLGNMGGLQQELESEWKKQEASFKIFGQQVCSKAGYIEQQRISLMNSLK